MASEMRQSGSELVVNIAVADPFTGQNQSKVVAVSSNKRLGGWRLKTHSVSNASLSIDGEHRESESLYLFLNQPDKASSTAAMDVAGAFASNCPDCWFVNLTGGPVKLLCRENLGAFDGPVLSDVSFEGSAIIRGRGRHTHCCRPHQITD